MKTNMRALPFCCGVRVAGDFGTEEYTCTKQEIIDECKGTGLFVSTFLLEQGVDAQDEAFKKLCKWFYLMYRSVRTNDMSGNHVTLCVFDVKPLQPKD